MRFSVGDKVVHIIMSDFETAYIRTIEHVDETTGLVFLNGCDGNYTKDSFYGYNGSTGRGLNNYAPGFSSRIIKLSDPT